MDKQLFTVKGAIQYAKEGKIEEWVHLFLNSVGGNVPFSEGLRLQERYWLGPILMDLDRLVRCCGPEEDIEFVEPAANWESTVLRMQKLIREGWEVPPLIAENIGCLKVSDGNHRHEALKREGYTKYWVILWDSDSPDNLSKLREVHGE